MIGTLRFFRVVGLLHPMMVLAFSIALAVATATLFVTRVYAASSFHPLFLLQALASSTGFMAPARRGHYDLLLTGGHRRIWIGIVHWIVSIAPGVAGWLALAAGEWAISGRTAISLAPGTVAGMFLISTLPWAATVVLPRLGGGLTWLTVVVLVMSVISQSGRDPLVMAESRGPFGRTAALLICPWFLVGRGLTGSDVIAEAAAIAIGAVSVAGGLYWIQRADIPLETAQ